MAIHPLRAAAAAAVCAACAFSQAGCTATVSAGPGGYVATTGRLVLHWTINGSTDPNACNQSAVTNIDIRILFADGTFQGEYVGDCSSFGTTIDLPEGRYSGSGELRDANNNPRTTTIDINPFDIVGDTDLNVSIDFPSSSFH